jgi:hypothetical protein
MKTVKLPRNKILQILRVLTAISGDKMPSKGAYAVLKNKKAADKERELLEEIQKNLEVPEGINDYEVKRLELCEEFCLRNEEGEPVKVRDQLGRENFQFSEEMLPAWQEAINNLTEEYKEPLEAKRKIEEDFNNLMDEEVEIKFHLVKLEMLPDEISPAVLEAIEDIIDEG